MMFYYTFITSSKVRILRTLSTPDGIEALLIPLDGALELLLTVLVNLADFKKKEFPPLRAFWRMVAASFRPPMKTKPWVGPYWQTGVELRAHYLKEKWFMAIFYYDEH